MRSAEIQRDTLETKIKINLALDGQGKAQLQTGIGFFDHMLQQIAKHAQLDISLQAEGDLHIDAHHTIEDVGICLGQAIKQSLADMKGLNRYGYAYVPLDETLSRVVVDLSGRPGLFFNVSFSRARIGDFDVDLVREFFQSLVNHAGITLHIDLLRGYNAHHQVESVFKAFARALRMAITMDDRSTGVPSTKGKL